MTTNVIGAILLGKLYSRLLQLQLSHKYMLPIALLCTILGGEVVQSYVYIMAKASGLNAFGLVIILQTRCYGCISLRNYWLESIKLFTFKTTQSVCLKRVGRKSPLAVTTESVADYPSGRAPEKGKGSGRSQLASLCSAHAELQPVDKSALWKMRSV